jgi:tRNA threonylcarbamoyladenosine modification (KEOPS) complex  Pcc1 subunit
MITCSNEKIAEVIAKGLEPENKELTKTDIETKTEAENVIISIESKSSISSLRHTIDDIIHTISLIEKVYNTVEK